MTIRTRRGAWLTTALILVAAGAGWWIAGPSFVADLSTAEMVALAGAAMIGELLPLPRAHGRGVTLTIAVLGMAALLGQPPLLVAGLAVLAWLGGVVATVLQGRSIRRFSLLRPLLGGWAMAGLAAVGSHLFPSLAIELGPAAGSITYSSVLLCGAVILVGLPALDAGEVADKKRWRFTTRFDELFRASWMSGAALAASAAVGAVTFDVMGWAALLLVLLPMLAARAGLRRFVDIRRTYDETVRAMSRLPEQLGGLPADHGLRVAQLCRTTGWALELDYRTRRNLERAAHLHELGRIELDPDEHAPAARLARSGGEILREAGSLEPVATIIEQHRYSSVEASPREALAADILRLACDVDRGTVAGAETAGATSSALAREVLHNPAVATAMARALDDTNR